MIFHYSDWFLFLIFYGLRNNRLNGLIYNENNSQLQPRLKKEGALNPSTVGRVCVFWCDKGAAVGLINGLQQQRGLH